MRYSLVFNHDHSEVEIAVDRRCSRKDLSFSLNNWKPIYGRTEPLVMQLFHVEGIVQVRLMAYSLSIKKGRSFHWEEILPAVLGVLRMCMDPDGVIEQYEEPVRVEYSPDGRTQLLPSKI